MKTVVRKIGNSEGVILPKEMLETLGLSAGDRLEVLMNNDGIQLLKANTDFSDQMEAARLCMVKYRDVLRELAK
ncbi:MAG: AbrB/MazE/SpoVT family DNA-binding domain-containing protein [Rhizobiaceae bacterium]|nr:AbrB/MazE/SpoVT family DNA-binding domain-containing protein [Rhizobiaceae bacterium]